MNALSNPRHLRHYVALITCSLLVTIGCAAFAGRIAGKASGTGILAVTSQSSGTTAVWTGATGTDWSAASNWFGGVVPASVDDVEINAGPNQPVIGAASACHSITIGTGASLTVSGSSVLSVSGDWNCPGTFTAGSGTVLLNGSEPQQIGGGSATTFNNLTISGTGPVSFSTTPVINGTLRVEGAAELSSAPVFGPSAALVYCTTTSRESGPEWLNPFNAAGGVTVSGSGTVILTGDKATGSSVPLAIGNGATLETGGFQLTLGGNLLNSGGTIGAGGSAVVIAGTMNGQEITGFTTTGPVTMTKTAGTATFSGSVNAGALTINGVGGTLDMGAGFVHTFSGDITVSAGSMKGNTSTIRANGPGATSWTGSGSGFSAESSTVVFGAGNQVINSAATFHNLVLNGSGAKRLGAMVTVTGDLTLASGTLFNMSSFLLTLQGSFVNNGGTTSGSGGVTLSGTASQSIGTLVNTGALTMAKTSGTATFTGNITAGALVMNGAGGTLNLGTELLHSFSGTWNRGEGTLNGGSSILRLSAATPVSGSAGSFIPASGTVEYSGAAQPVATMGYHHLTLSGSGAKTFSEGITIGGNLTLSGTVSVAAVEGLEIGGSLAIGDGCVFDAGAFSYVIGGCWSNSGTFRPGTSTVTFTGADDAVISGGSITKFNQLIIDKPSAELTTTATVNVAGLTHVKSGSFSAPAACHDLLIESGATLRGKAGSILYIKGDWTNQGTFDAGGGTVIFNGTETQTIGGTVPTSFMHLGIAEGAGGSVVLDKQATVTGMLTLTGGLLSLGSNDLTVGDIAGGSTSSYIQTGGTGRLVREIRSSATGWFPVGQSAYNPVGIRNNNAGGTDWFSLRAADGAVANANTGATVNRKWYMHKGPAGTTNITVFITYNTGEEGTGFDPGEGAKVGFFNGFWWSFENAATEGNTWSATGDLGNGTLYPDGFLTLGTGAAFSATKFAVTVRPENPIRGAGNTRITVKAVNSQNIPTWVKTATSFDLSATNTQFTATQAGGTIGANSSEASLEQVTFTESTLNPGGTAYEHDAVLTATLAVTNPAGEQLSDGSTGSFDVYQGRFYRPKTSGNWSQVTWEKSADGISWPSAGDTLYKQTFSASEIVRVESGTDLTADVDVSCYSMLIDGTLDLAPGSTLTLNHTSGDESDYNLHVHGTLRNSGGVLNNTVPASPVEFHGGTYEHTRNGGSIPSAVWHTYENNHAICRVTGITDEALSGGLAQSFDDFTWDNTGQTVDQPLTGDLEVAGNLQLSKGTITTGDHFVVTGINATVSRSTGYIDGRMRVFLPQNVTEVLFPVGEGPDYTPVSLAFDNFTGNDRDNGHIDVYTTSEVPPAASGLNPSSCVSRKWTVSNFGVTGYASYSPSFTYTSGDLTGSPASESLRLRRFDNGTWHTTNGAASGLTMTATGLDTFSEFRIGAESCGTGNNIWFGSIDSDWNNAANWCSGTVPGSGTSVTIPSGPALMPVISGTAQCAGITVENGASLNFTGTAELHVTGNWNCEGTLVPGSGTVFFEGTATQTILGDVTFSNLTVDNAAGVSAASGFTVNGTLNLASANPDASHGALDMGSFTLKRTAAGATLTGSGEVTGIVNRTHTFASNIPYAFGSEHTTLTFLGLGTRPGEVSCRLVTGEAPALRPGAVERYYSWAQTGSAGTDKVSVSLHYNADELNGNDAARLVVYDIHPTGNIDEHGRSDYSTTDHRVSLSGFSIGYLAPAGNLNEKYIFLENYSAERNTWLGNSTAWTNVSNWSKGNVPVATDDVLIPEVSSGLYPSLEADAVTGTMEIAEGASLAANSAAITVYGARLAWSNHGSFDPGTGSVKFDHASLSDVVSVSGTTQFHNLYFGATTFIQPGNGTVTKISGLANGDPASIVDLSSYGNTVEFNGEEEQLIINPITNGFDHSGFYHLIFSGTGVKTLYDDVELSGNLTLNGTFDPANHKISFTGYESQQISGSVAPLFHDLAVLNPSGVTALTGMTVNGALTMPEGNPSGTSGALNMEAPFVLDLGEEATVSGTGEVTGIIRRIADGSFLTDKFYSLGQEKTGVTFTNFEGQTLPAWISVRVTVGTPPSWEPSATVWSGHPPIVDPIARTIDFAQSQGYGTRALLSFHYNDGELPAGVDESRLDLWQRFLYNGQLLGFESGKSGQSLGGNYITLQDADLWFMSESLDDFQVAIAPSTTIYRVWKGVEDNSWNNPLNWDPAGIPDEETEVIIPDDNTSPFTPVLPSGDENDPAAIGYSILIETGGILNAPETGGMLTVAGPAWIVETGGLFNAGTSDVTFTGTEDMVGYLSPSGSTTFHNLNVVEGANLRPAAGAYIGITGTLAMNGTLSAVENDNTFEFKGSGPQTVPAPNGIPAGYRNLVLSGTGTRTLPETLNVTGNFINNSEGEVGFGGSTVVMSGNQPGQILGGTAFSEFSNLTVANPYGVTLARDGGIDGTLELAGGNLVLSGFNLTLGDNALISQPSADASHMVVADGSGFLRKHATSATEAGFTFPVGNGGDEPRYTPVTLTFTDGTYDGYSGVQVRKDKHPANASENNYLMRYWNLTQEGFSGFGCVAEAVYDDSDVAGSENQLALGLWNGSTPWTRFENSVYPDQNKLVSGTLTALGELTGIDGSDPLVMVSGGGSYSVGAAVTLRASITGNPEYMYEWSDGLGSGPMATAPTGIPGTALYTVTVTDGNGFVGTGTGTVTVQGGRKISGVFYYHAASGPIPITTGDIDIELYRSSDEGHTELLASTVTDGTGYYEFTGLAGGTEYDVVASTTHSSSGSVNTSDAAQANEWPTTLTSIEAVRFLAGDVGTAGTMPDGMINGTDAGRIQWNFVNNLAFDNPWRFWRKGVLTGSNAAPGSWPKVALAPDQDAVADMYALCTGDFNRSYNPNPMKASDQLVNLEYSGHRVAGTGQEVVLPLRMARSSMVGAISLVLDIPSDLATIHDVTVAGNAGRLAWNVRDRELRIGWLSADPLTLSDNEMVLNLYLETTGAFRPGQSIRVSLASDPMNEIADGQYHAISDVILRTEVVDAGSEGAPENTLVAGNDPTASPNPFTGSTSILWQMPEAGTVTLVVRDMLGRGRELVTNRPVEAGSRSLTIDGSEMAAGVYIATLKITTAEGTRARTVKLVKNR